MLPALSNDKVLVMRRLRGRKLEEALFGKNSRNFFTFSDVADRLRGTSADARTDERTYGDVTRAGIMTTTTATSSTGTGSTPDMCSDRWDRLITALLAWELLPLLLRVSYFLEKLYLWTVGRFSFVGGGTRSASGEKRDDALGGDEDSCEASTDDASPSAAEIRLRAEEIMTTLLGVHGEQIFYHGFFQADCHPGNFLILDPPEGGQEDSRGPRSREGPASSSSSFSGAPWTSLAAAPKIGLIDFGQAKVLSLDQRLRLARLVLAVADDRPEEMARVLREEFRIGGRKDALVGESQDQTVASDFFLEKLARSCFGGFDSKLTGGKSLREFSEEMRAHYSRAEIPGELYLPIRTSVLLRGIGLLLKQYVSPAEAWRPMAERVLREEGAVREPGGGVATHGGTGAAGGVTPA